MEKWAPVTTFFAGIYVYSGVSPGLVLAFSFLLEAGGFSAWKALPGCVWILYSYSNLAASTFSFMHPFIPLLICLLLNSVLQYLLNNRHTSRGWKWGKKKNRWKYLLSGEKPALNLSTALSVMSSWRIVEVVGFLLLFSKIFSRNKTGYEEKKWWWWLWKKKKMQVSGMERGGNRVSLHREARTSYLPIL